MNVNNSLCFRYNEAIYNDLLFENQLDMEFYNYAKLLAAARLSLSVDFSIKNKWNTTRKELSLQLPPFCPKDVSKTSNKITKPKQNKQLQRHNNKRRDPV